MAHQMNNQKMDSGTIVRRAIILAVLLVFILAAFFLIGRIAARQRAGIHTAQHSEAASVQSDHASLSGYYTLRAYSLNGETHDADALEKEGRGSWYLLFNGDGSGYACIMDQKPCGFQDDGREIRLEDGSIYPYQVTEDSLTLYGSAVMIFAQGEPNPEEEDAHGFQLANSTWSGTLKISKHSGKGSLTNGERPVWGIIKENSSGEYYFELYDKEFYTIEDLPVLSMWVNVFDDHIEPVSDQEDAWFFDLQLTGDELNVFKLYLKDDHLSRSFWYTCGKEHCNIYFEIFPDP